MWFSLLRMVCESPAAGLVISQTAPTKRPLYMILNIYSYLLYWEQKFLGQFMWAPNFFFVVILFAPLFFACLSLTFLPCVSGISKPLRLFLPSRGYVFQYLGIFCLKYPNKFSTPQMLQYLTKFCQLFRKKGCVLNSSTSFLRQGIKFCHNDGSLVIIRKICLLLSSYSSICEWRSVSFMKNVLSWLTVKWRNVIPLLQK